MSNADKEAIPENGDKSAFQMKRQNPDNRGGHPAGGSKRYRADPYNEALAEGKFEFRFLLPTKCAGAVIGRGGENIKAVRDKYDATLTVPDRSTPERVFTIIVAQDRLPDCFAEVLTKLNDMPELQSKKNTDLEIRVLVHQSHAGAIIGRGGAKIKELREQTESHLKVFQECCPLSTDRVVQITAPASRLPNVIKTLVDFQREVAIKGIQKPYDAANYDPRIVFGYGGYATDKPFMPQGGPRGGGGFQQMGGYQGDFNRGGPPPYGVPPYPRQGPGGIPPVPMPGGFMGDQGVQTTQVTIPNELGGTIIGKGGERINRIRQESGARIDIGNGFGADERIITIAGTQPQIQTAQYLLQQSVRTSEAGRRYLREQR